MVGELVVTGIMTAVMGYVIGAASGFGFALTHAICGECHLHYTVSNSSARAKHFMCSIECEHRNIVKDALYHCCAEQRKEVECALTELIVFGKGGTE